MNCNDQIDINFKLLNQDLELSLEIEATEEDDESLSSKFLAVWG